MALGFMYRPPPTIGGDPENLKLAVPNKAPTVLRPFGGLGVTLKGVVWIRSYISSGPQNQKPNRIKEGLPNNGLKLNKRLPKHIIQGLFTKASALS